MSDLSSTRNELIHAVAARIVQRTGRRVSDISVSYHDMTLVVRGNANSYHAWQLTIAACRDIIDRSPRIRLDCCLDVSQNLASRRNLLLQSA
jgi:hypothetical protein